MVQVHRRLSNKSKKTLKWVSAGVTSTVALVLGDLVLLSLHHLRGLLQQHQQTSSFEISLATPPSAFVPYGSRRELWNGPFIPSTIGNITDVEPSSSWINDYNLVHVVNTRFMQHQADLQHLGMARVDLFNTFTLPSMKQQSNQQYLWLIWTDAKLHDPVKSTFLKVLQESQMQNVIVVAPPKTEVDTTATFRSFYGYSLGDLTGKQGTSVILYGNVQLLTDYYKASQTHLLLETSLDADDALSQSFVETAQAEAAYNMENNAVDNVERNVYCPEFHAEWRYYQPLSSVPGSQQDSQGKQSVNPFSGSEPDKNTSWLPDRSRNAHKNNHSNAIEVDGHLVHMHNRNFCIKSGLTIAYHLKAKARRLSPCTESQEHRDCIDVGRRSLGSTVRDDQACNKSESAQDVHFFNGDGLSQKTATGTGIDWTKDMSTPKFTIPDGTKKRITCGNQCSQSMDYKNCEQNDYCPIGSMLCRGKDYGSGQFLDKALFTFAELAFYNASAMVRFECRPSHSEEDILFFDVNILDKNGEYVTKFNVDYYGTQKYDHHSHCDPWNYDKDYKVTMSYLRSFGDDHFFPEHSYFRFEPTKDQGRKLAKALTDDHDDGERLGGKGNPPKTYSNPAKPSASPPSAPTPPPRKPTVNPTKKTRANPNMKPTSNPTRKSRANPTKKPTAHPTKEPSVHPTKKPTAHPTKKPTANPTTTPTSHPTRKPSVHPTSIPTQPSATSLRRNPTQPSQSTPPTAIQSSKPTQATVNTPGKPTQPMARRKRMKRRKNPPRKRMKRPNRRPKKPTKPGAEPYLKPNKPSANPSMTSNKPSKDIGEEDENEAQYPPSGPRDKGGDDDDDVGASGPSPSSSPLGENGHEDDGPLPVAPFGGSHRSEEYFAYGVKEFAICVAPVLPPTKEERDCIARLRLLPEVSQTKGTDERVNNHLNVHYKPLQASVLMARTPTAAGMKNVLPQKSHDAEHNDRKNSVMLATFGDVGSDEQHHAWNLVEENFGLIRNHVLAMRQERMQPNMENILLDAFTGQCTPGHSCKSSAKQALGKLLTQLHYDNTD